MIEQTKEIAHVVYGVDVALKDEKSPKELEDRIKRDTSELHKKLLAWLQGIDAEAQVSVPDFPSIAPSSVVEASADAIEQLTNMETRPAYIEAAVRMDS